MNVLFVRVTSKIQHPSRQFVISHQITDPGSIAYEQRLLHGPPESVSRSKCL